MARGVHIAFLRGGRHSAHNSAMLQHVGGGAYNLDKGAADDSWKELPELCAFSKDGLLEGIRGSCEGDLTVYVDRRYGAIPVCEKHTRLVELVKIPGPGSLFGVGYYGDVHHKQPYRVHIVRKSTRLAICGRGGKPEHYLFCANYVAADLVDCPLCRRSEIYKEAIRVQTQSG